MRKLLVALASSFFIFACAQSVTSPVDEPQLAAQSNEPQDSGVKTTASNQGNNDSGSGGNDSSTPPADSGPKFDGNLPDVGPPPPDAATGGGGICDLNNLVYAGKAIIEINKSSPRQCNPGCGPTECCFWVYQVCVDL